MKGNGNKWEINKETETSNMEVAVGGLIVIIVLWDVEEGAREGRNLNGWKTRPSSGLWLRNLLCLASRNRSRWYLIFFIKFKFAPLGIVSSLK